MLKFSFAVALVASVVVSGCSGGHAGNSVVPSGLRSAGTSALRTTAASALSYQDLVVAANPIAYYRLNDTSTVLADSGNQHLLGTYGANVRHGGVTLTSGAGSQSSLFPGSPAGSVIAPNTATVPTSAAFAAAGSTLTVEAWIAPSARNLTNHFVPIVSYGREAQGQAWVLQVSPQSTLDFWMKTKGGSAPSFEVKGGAAFEAGQPHQVAATYDGSAQRLYLDGVLVGTSAASGTIDYSGLTSATGLAIGGALGSGEPIFDGAISDVSIYASTLLPATIAQHDTAGQTTTTNPQLNSGAYAALVAASKPTAYYPLRDTGASMTDSSGHQLDGAYGANVRHGGSALTSTGAVSSIFPGSPAGADIASNTGTVPANRAFYIANNVTVEAWVKPVDFNRTTATMPLVSYGRGSIGSVWSLQLNAQARLAFSVKVAGTASPIVITGLPLLPSQVYQVVATYDGSSARLYINGALVTTSPVTGALDYTNIPSHDGVTVGGALGGTTPIFNGAMSDVSIYPNPLTADVIEQHYLVGHLVSKLLETPKNSDALVDSIGVVTHLRATGGPYAQPFSITESLLRASGIRHIGDAFSTNPASYVAEINALAADGIHASLITDPTQTAQSIAATIPAFGSAIDAVEGTNEPDKSKDPNWIADTRAFQMMLWSTVKGNPATAQLRVVGPALTSFASDTALGDLSSYMDYGSMHDYFDGYNPGTAGWGNLHVSGIYGSVSYNQNLVSVVSGSKPAVATETGYGNAATDGGGVDNRTLARYVPRLYLEHFLDGVVRSTIYELYDEPGGGNFDDFGLVTLANTPKTSYYALQTLIGTLADPGGTFPTTPLAYTLAGNMNNVHHLLLQKRDGTYELAIWLETASYDPSAKVDITVPPQAVTFQPEIGLGSATMSTIGDTGGLQTTTVPFSGGIATIPVDDRVSILSFK